jgi:serine/threonine protein kinase
VFPDVLQHPALRGFEFLGRLGAGGAGQVFLAKSRGGRKVAIKILREPKDGEEQSFDALAREASLCVRLNHPAIVRVRAFVEEDGLAALVLDYVGGPPLARLLKLAGAVGARLPDPVAWFIVERILAALAYAHAQTDDSGAPAPIVHRDLSPSNVLVDWTGDVKITDFGIAKMLGVSPATRYGLVKGTLGCMAPEQARGEPVDQRADVYAAGLLAWRLATGRLPFDPRMAEVDLLRAMRYPKIRPLSALRSDLPNELLQVMEAALAPELSRRTFDCAELHRVVVSSFDVEQGRADLAELLERWRAQLERVKSPKDTASRTSDSSGDKKIPTLRYEEVEVLDEDYPMDSPTVEAHALPGDEHAWSAGALPASSLRGGALPVIKASPWDRDSSVPAEVQVLRVDSMSLPTPISMRGLPSHPTQRPRVSSKATRRRVWRAVAAVAFLLFVVECVWMMKAMK